MKKSAGKMFLLSVFLFLNSPYSRAQDDVAPLKNLKKIMFNITWRGDVSPYDIGINADSLFQDFQFNLTEGSLLEEVIDARGISSGTKKIPLLIIDIQIQTFLDDYIFYFISMALFEQVQFERMDNSSYSSITWVNQNYDAFEKDRVAENLKASLSKMHWGFITAYNKDNGLE
jgi:hypothetical protein